jgi:hypothetical protein
MTELNDEHTGRQAQPTPNWPGTEESQAGDPKIAAIVEALGGVADRPVAEHEAVYSELHDALLLALNEDAPNGDGKA